MTRMREGYKNSSLTGTSLRLSKEEYCEENGIPRFYTTTIFTIFLGTTITFLTVLPSVHF